MVLALSRACDRKNSDLPWRIVPAVNFRFRTRTPYHLVTMVMIVSILWCKVSRNSHQCIQIFSISNSIFHASPYWWTLSRLIHAQIHRISRHKQYRIITQRCSIEYCDLKSLQMIRISTILYRLMIQDRQVIMCDSQSCIDRFRYR